VLALSWSPTYCAGAGERRDDVQCAPGRGRGGRAGEQQAGEAGGEAAHDQGRAIRQAVA
jgi:hypothetical protein